MRSRERILASLEKVYREAFTRAEEADDAEEMARLDFEYQRDQLWLEAILDVRGLLAGGADVGGGAAGEGGAGGVEKVESILEKAAKLRRLTRLR